MSPWQGVNTHRIPPIDSQWVKIHCGAIWPYHGSEPGAFAMWIGEITTRAPRKLGGAAIRTWIMANRVDFRGIHQDVDFCPRRPNRPMCNTRSSEAAETSGIVGGRGGGGAQIAKHRKSGREGGMAPRRCSVGFRQVPRRPAVLVFLLSMAPLGSAGRRGGPLGPLASFLAPVVRSTTHTRHIETAETLAIGEGG